MFHGAHPLPDTLSSKSPVLAGFLSAYIPGSGSFYAGDSGHGIRHLVVVPLASMLLFVGGGVLGDAGVVPAYAGLGLLVFNWPWSVVTAVRDARAHNALVVASGSTSTGLSSPLAVGRSLPSQPPLLEIRLVEIRF